MKNPDYENKALSCFVENFSKISQRNRKGLERSSEQIHSKSMCMGLGHQTYKDVSILEVKAFQTPDCQRQAAHFGGFSKPGDSESCCIVTSLSWARVRGSMQMDF